MRGGNHIGGSDNVKGTSDHCFAVVHGGRAFAVYVSEGYIEVPVNVLCH